MTEQEQKAYEQLASQVDKKIEEVAERTRKGLVTEDQIAELKAMMPKVQEYQEKANKEREKIHADFNELKGQFDELNLKLAKGLTLTPQEQKTFKEVTEELLTEKKGLLVKMREEGLRMSFMDVSIKAVGPVLTTGNITGDLPRQFRQQLVSPPNRRVHIRSLLPQGPLNSAIYTYPVIVDGEGDFAIQTEGAAKAKWDVDVQMKDSKPVVIAATIDISNQMLDDVPYLANYINNRGIEKLLRVEDNELLNGTGSTNRLNGILRQATVYSTGLGTQASKANANRWDVLVDAATQIETRDYEANGILLHPADYSEMVLTKTTAGEYTYPGFAAGTMPFTVAGIPVYKSTAVARNSFLLGDWGEAEMLTRDAINIVMSTENKDNIEKNLVTIRIEERIALNVYQPDAFIQGTFGNIGS